MNHRKIVLIIYILLIITGHTGKLIVEKKCDCEYFVPDTLISKVTFFVVLTPIDGFFDLLEGVTSEWDKTCEKVRNQQDPEKYKRKAT